VKKRITKYLSTLIIIALLIALPSCSSDAEARERQTYKVTMYSGGEVVREWHGVSFCNRYSDGITRLEVDGTYIDVVGDVVIEVEP